MTPLKIRFLFAEWAKVPCKCGKADCVRWDVTYRLQNGSAVDHPIPGDVFYERQHVQLSGEPFACSYWDNCTSGHLTVVLPSKHTHYWDVDSRASNCTKPADRTHRCWIKHGDPRDGTLHIDKAGNTCNAGAGSILADGWHGFLRSGYLVE